MPTGGRPIAGGRMLCPPLEEVAVSIDRRRRLVLLIILHIFTFNVNLLRPAGHLLQRRIKFRPA